MNNYFGTEKLEHIPIQILFSELMNYDENTIKYFLFRLYKDKNFTYHPDFKDIFFKENPHLNSKDFIYQDYEKQLEIERNWVSNPENYSLIVTAIKFWKFFKTDVGGYIFFQLRNKIDVNEIKNNLANFGDKNSVLAKILEIKLGKKIETCSDMWIDILYENIDIIKNIKIYRDNSNFIYDFFCMYRDELDDLFLNVQKNGHSE